MKKFLIFLFFLTLLPFTFSFKPVLLDIATLDGVIFSNIEYCVYSLGANDTENINYDIIDNGSNIIFRGDINFAKEMKKNAKDIMGESICFKSLKSKVTLISNFYKLEILQSEEFDDIISLYGYSDKLGSQKSIIIDGKEVNMQIVFNDGYITVGTPIILGEYWFLRLWI